MPSSPAKRPRGRPTKLDADVERALLRVLRAGGYLATAAHVAGVDPATLRRWMARGAHGTERRDAPYRALLAKIDQARAEAEARNVALIAQAATTNGQAAAWLLERQAPERWARPAPRVLPAAEPPPAVDDPFAEVDELAQQRRKREQAQ